MTGGFGHIADMIVRIRNNTNLLKKQTYLRKRELYLKAQSQVLLNQKIATPEDLTKIRDNVKRLRRDEIKRSVISLLLAIILVALVLFAFLRFATRFIKD